MSEPKDFEGALERLEAIVKELESGELTLEQSLERYELGVRLARFCHAKLDEAERRIEILQKGEDGAVRRREDGSPLSRPAELDDDARS